MKKLLIIVDYQYDFVAEDGALSCGKPALEILPALEKTALEYTVAGHDIIFTHDAHDITEWSNHPESRKFPPHCVSGTKGCEVYGAALQKIENEYPRARRVDKKAYCVDFAEINGITAMNYDIIELCGVTTDICVLQNFTALYTAIVNGGKPTKLRLLEDCCASFDQAGHEFAVKYMQNTVSID